MPMSTSLIPPDCQAIFFDFDGVLVDSNAIKSKAFESLFAAYGNEVIARILAYHRHHGGISRVEKIRYAFAEILHVPLSEALLKQLAGRYSQLVIDAVIAAPWIGGARELLTRISPHIPLFIISGTPEPELRQIVSRRKMSDFFLDIAGSPITKPDHLRRLLAIHHLQPECSLFIGDSHTDWQSARQFGMPFLGIQGEYHFPSTVKVLRDCTPLAEEVISLVG